MPLNPNSSTPITPARVLLRIAANLVTWFATSSYAYTVRVAEDAEAALGLLCEEDAGGRCIIRWDGDQAFGGSIRQGDIAVNRFAIVVTRSASLSPDPGETLTAGNTPFLAHVAAIRARILSYGITGDYTEGFFRYVGTNPVSLPDGLPIAAYEIVVTLKTAIPVDPSKNTLDLANPVVPVVPEDPD